MPEESNENCLGDDCTDCSAASFTMTITEQGSGDLETEDGRSLRTESGRYLRIE